MEQTYSLGMAYYDFVPVVFFLIGGFFLIKICLFAHQKYLTWLMTVGIIFIGLGGAFQATWKLLYIAGIANVVWMKNMQFIFMSIWIFRDSNTRHHAFPAKQKDKAGSHTGNARLENFIFNDDDFCQSWNLCITGIHINSQAFKVGNSRVHYCFVKCTGDGIISQPISNCKFTMDRTKYKHIREFGLCPWGNPVT